MKFDASQSEAEAIPLDSRKEFAISVNEAAIEYATELVKDGRTEVEARNAIIHQFLDFAAGEACRIARREGRYPNHELWAKTTNDAFKRAVSRTAPRAADSQPEPPEAA